MGFNGAGELHPPVTCRCLGVLGLTQPASTEPGIASPVTGDERERERGPLASTESGNRSPVTG